VARIAPLERQNKELKAKFVQVETAQMTKTKATSAASRGKNSNLEQRQAGSLKVRTIAADV
jgi:hypothetical protein